MIYTGLIESKNNTIAISDIVNGSRTSVINVTIKAPTSTSTKRTLNMNVEEYENGKKIEELTFNGQLSSN